MDHFYQLPMLGPPDNYMLECYTTLGALARETHERAARRARHRQHVPQPGGARQGRHRARHRVAMDGRSSASAPAGSSSSTTRFGIEFGTFTDRFEKLEEALQIILPMLRGERPSLDGKHYQVKDAINEPPPDRPHPRHDRRLRREEDAAHGGAVRRRVEPHVAVGSAAAQARSARRALRAARPRPRRDHGQPAPQRRDRRHASTTPTRPGRRVPARAAASTSRRWTRTAATVS